MSDTGSLILRGIEDQTKLPLQWAQTSQTLAQIPLYQAQAAEAQAHVPYYGALTTKQQIENEQNRLILDKGIKPGFEQQPDNSNVTIPRPGGDPLLQPPPPPAAQSPSAYPPPAANAPPPPPRVPASVWVPPGSPAATGTSTAMRYPGAYNVADISGTTPPPASAALVEAGQPSAPPPPTPQAMQLAQAGRPPQPGVPPQPGSAALQGQGPYNAAGLAPGSVFMPGVGPVPAAVNRDFWIGVAHGQDPTALKANIASQRYRRLTEEASGASSAADWDARVTNMYREGLIDNQTANQLIGHYEQKDYWVDKMQSAAEQSSAAINRRTQGVILTPQGTQVDPTAAAGVGSTTRARTEAEGQTQLWTVPGPDGRPQEVRVPLSNTQQFLEEQRRLGITPKPGAVVPGPGSSNAPAGGSGASMNVTRNNSGNLMFANQPGAFRVAGDQFAHFPDVPTGVAAQADQLAINQDTHGINSVADQVKWWVHDPKADLRTYIADTAAALGVDPNARVNWHDPDVQAKFIQASQPHETGGQGRYLAPADVQRGVQMAAARRGTQYAGPGVPQTPADAIVGGMVGAGANPATLETGRPGGAAGPQVAQSRYGVPTGVPVWTPEQKEAAERDRPLIAADTTNVSGLGTDQLALDQSISSMHDVLARVDESITGKGSDWRRNLSAGLKQFGPGWVQDFAKRLSDGNIDPSKTENSEVVMKQLFLASQQAESQLIRHGGLGSSQLYASMFPNPNMQPGSIKEMTNFLSMMQQRTRDWNQGALTHYNQNYDIRPGEIDPATGAPKRYQPLSKFTQEFNRTGSENAPQVYGAAVAILNHKTPDSWTKGLSDEQQWAAIQTVKRADPTYKFTDKALIPKKFWPKEWQD